jgi:hypothetical protein
MGLGYNDHKVSLLVVWQYYRLYDVGDENSEAKTVANHCYIHLPLYQRRPKVLMTF